MDVAKWRCPICGGAGESIHDGCAEEQLRRQAARAAWRSEAVARHWFAAIVRRGKERRFAEHLGGAGFLGYIPMHKKKWIIGRAPRRVEYRDAPIIWGLVFIGAAADLARDPYAWQAVAALEHYRALVGMGGEPRTIAQSEIDVMMDARRDKDDLHTGYVSAVPVGEQARMVAGPWQGRPMRKLREFQVQGLAGRRAEVLARVLGGERVIEVDDADLALWAAE